MIGIIQTYLTLLGLLADVAGVVVVSHYWLKGVGGGLQKLLKTQTDLNLRWGADARKMLAELSEARVSGAGWWKLFGLELSLAARRMNARIYNERVKHDRRHNGMSELSILTADDYWHDPAINAHYSEMRSYYEDLVAQGAPNSVFPLWGFRLIIGGFALQFLGALPIA